MKTCMFCFVPVFLLTTMGSLASGADIMDGVVGVWLFDEGSGDKAEDSSDAGNDGDFQGKLRGRARTRQEVYRTRQ